MRKLVLKMEEFVFEAPNPVPLSEKDEVLRVFLLLDHEHGSMSITPKSISGIVLTPQDKHMSFRFVRMSGDRAKLWKAIAELIAEASEFGMQRLLEVEDVKGTLKR